MKKIILFLGLVVGLSAVARFIIINRSAQTQQKSDINLRSVPNRSLVTATLKNQSFQFEVVNTYSSQLLGLSNRDEIGSDGMLFVFDRVAFHQIWMKDMKFDLDLIWINDNQVVGFSLSVAHPEPNTPDNLLTIYRPPGLVNMVLETQAGFVEQNQIQVGDELKIIEE